MKTILQVLPRLNMGGVERGTLEMAEAIIQQGWKSVVASEGGKLVHSLHGSHHRELPLASKNPLQIYKNINHLKNVIQEEKVDLVHVRSRAPAWSVWGACASLGVPWITTYHAPYNGKTSLKKAYNKVMTRGCHIIAISGFVKDHILAQYPDIDPSKITVVHRGCDINYFRPQSANRRDYGLPEDLPVVLMPSRLTRWKGQKFVLEALREGPPLCLFLVGTGRAGYVDELKNAVPPHIQLVVMENCEDIRIPYSLCDIVISASTDPEGFGRVMIEAGAMEKPVIASNHGAAPEIIEEGVTGWLFNSEDSRSFVQCLLKALESPLYEMGKAGRQRVLEHFTTALMAQKTIAVYEHVLSRY